MHAEVPSNLSYGPTIILFSLAAPTLPLPLSIVGHTTHGAVGPYYSMGRADEPHPPLGVFYGPIVSIRLE